MGAHNDTAVKIIKRLFAFNMPRWVAYAAVFGFLGLFYAFILWTL